MSGKKYDEMNVGDSASMTKTISESDVYLFAGITGDFNPVHVNKVAAENSIFKDRVAHGILSAGLISAVIGTKLPGDGVIYLSESLKFLKPVYFGDTITAKVTVAEKLEKNRVLLKTECFNQNDELVSVGESLVLPAK